MARAFVGANGFDEEVLGVGFASDDFARRFDENVGEQYTIYC